MRPSGATEDPLSTSCSAISLSPVEPPWSVNVRGVAGPDPKAIAPVLAKTSAALFAEPATRYMFPKTPSEAIVLLAASVKRRSMAIEGVCVSWTKEADWPTYWSVPPLRTKLAAALVEAPSELGMPPLARLVTASVPAVMTVAPV